jgi:hypothetical protein
MWHDVRIKAIGAAIEVYDGAPPSEAARVVDAALQELGRQGVSATREELAALAAQRFGHHFDFAELHARLQADAAGARAEGRRDAYLRLTERLCAALGIPWSDARASACAGLAPEALEELVLRVAVERAWPD